MSDEKMKEFNRINKELASLNLKEFFVLAVTEKNSHLLTRGEGKELGMKMAHLAAENSDLFSFLTTVLRLALIQREKIITEMIDKTPPDGPPEA